MQESYRFIIRDEKYAAYKKIASLLFIINAIFFASLAFSIAPGIHQLLLYATTVFLLCYAVYHWKYKKKKEWSYLFAYLLIGLIWFTETSFPYFAVMYLLLLLLQYRAENDLRFAFSAEFIIIDRLLKSRYEWSAFNNIMLKDGMLTLDFTNNKIMQVQPDWPTATGSDKSMGETGNSTMKDYPGLEKEFNDFCKQQLRKRVV